MDNPSSVNNDYSKKLRSISIEGCPVIGSGFHAVVYKTKPDEIVKVYRPGTSLEKIDRERKLARWAFVHGLPTAITFDVVTVGDRYGVVFELIDAVSSVEYINRSQECFDDFIAKSVKLMKEIHSIEVIDEDFPDMKQNTFKWIEEIRDLLPGEVTEKLEKMLRQIPDSHTLLHADFHIKNILVCKGELMLIDMDTLCKDDPLFELATIYNSYRQFPDIDPEAAAFIGITPETGRKIWDKTLRLYYLEASEKELGMIGKKAQILGCIRIINFMNRHKDHPGYETVVTRCLEDLKAFGTIS